jgi:hypothetical protein
MPLYALENELPSLTDPVVVAAFDGWVDAAAAASSAMERLAADTPVIARFDVDAIYDYRSRRPVLDVVDGRLSDLVWPELLLRHAWLGGRDVLLLTGAEPDLRWRALAAEVRELLSRLGVVQWISLGAVPATVPHTRPVPVMATASRDGLLGPEDVRRPGGLLRVPSAALSALELEVTAAGLPAVGFFAQVPPYVGGGYAAASLALLEHLARHLGITLDLDDLADLESRERTRYDQAAAADPETQEMIARLEAMAGEDELRLPSGDELAREIQRFLRDRTDEDDPPA